MAWRDYINKDAGWKLFSLLLAILIWGSIRPRPEGGVPLRRTVANPLQSAPPASISTSEPITRPVVVLHSPAAAYRYRIMPPLVDVVVQGQSALLKALNEDEIIAFVDGAELERRTNSTAGAAACAIQVHAPPGVRFLKSNPTAVQVERLPAPPPAEAQSPPP